MKEVKVYRRRSLTLLMMLFFGIITALMIVGLILSYIPDHTQLEDLRITGTKRTISLIFMLFTAGVTWRYAVGFIRRGKRPVIRITDDYVRFELRVNDPDKLYFHDVESFSPIEGNFETAVVKYRVPVPEGSPLYPSAIEVPIGLTMNRTQVLAELNKRAADGASKPAPPVVFPEKDADGDELETDADGECAKAARNLPPRDKTVKVYWERWAPVVVEIGIMLIIGLILWVKSDPEMHTQYLFFIKMTMWCDVIIWVFVVLGFLILIYLALALYKPKLVIMADGLRFRGQTVFFADLRNVTVETTRKRVAQNRYVTEHFIRFNYRNGAEVTPDALHGLEPDLLEMRPARIAAIINSRIPCKG